MITHDLVVAFPRQRAVSPEPASWNPRPNPCGLYVDLYWTRHSQTEFIAQFRLTETGENPTMMTLRRTVALDMFLDWHGRTFDEALARWATLQDHYRDRVESDDPRVYLGTQDIKIFYDELARGNRPKVVELAVVEHY